MTEDYSDSSVEIPIPKFNETSTIINLGYSNISIPFLDWLKLKNKISF